MVKPLYYGFMLFDLVTILPKFDAIKEKRKNYDLHRYYQECSAIKFLKEEVLIHKKISDILVKFNICFHDEWRRSCYYPK